MTMRIGGRTNSYFCECGKRWERKGREPVSEREKEQLLELKALHKRRFGKEL